MDTIQVLLLVIIIVIIGVIVYIKFTDSGKALAKKYLPSFIAGFESEQFSADEEAMKKEKNLISMISRSDLIPGEIKTQVIDRITNGQVSELQIIEMLKPYVPVETINDYINGAMVMPGTSVSDDPLIEKSMNKNLLNYHMQIDPSVGMRNVVPTSDKEVSQNISDNGSIAEMLGIIKNDSPAVRSNGEFLPGSVKQTVPSNSIISSRIIYQRKPKSRLIDRHGDPRPYPDTQVNMIMGSNGKDPNSLKFSENVSPYDSLQSGRGVFGNAYLDQTMDKMENIEITNEGEKTFTAMDKSIGETAPIKDLAYNNANSNMILSELRNPTQRIYGTNSGGALSY